MLFGDHALANKAFSGKGELCWLAPSSGPLREAGAAGQQAAELA
jgi:hypothetical protein